MRSFFPRAYIVGAALVVFAAPLLSSQEPRLALNAQTANGQITFHIGERIPVELSFTSPNDTQYTIAPWSSGRGGEFDFEGFDVSPSTGWSDPLAHLFRYPVVGMVSGIPRWC